MASDRDSSPVPHWSRPRSWGRATQWQKKWHVGTTLDPSQAISQKFCWPTVARWSISFLYVLVSHVPKNINVGKSKQRNIPSYMDGIRKIFGAIMVPNPRNVNTLGCCWLDHGPWHHCPIRWLSLTPNSDRTKQFNSTASATSRVLQTDKSAGCPKTMKTRICLMFSTHQKDRFTTDSPFVGKSRTQQSTQYILLTTLLSPHMSIFRNCYKWVKNPFLNNTLDTGLVKPKIINWKFYPYPLAPTHWKICPTGQG